MSRARPTIRRRQLARALKRLREENGRTTAEIAALLECKTPKISKIETGKANVNPSELRALLDYYEVADERADELVQLGREARQRGWWQAHSDAIPTWLRDYIGFESDAADVVAYESELIPGLVQTESYARCVIAACHPHATEEELNRRVAFRMARQQVLSSDADGPRYWMILNEAALRRGVGGPMVMREQLNHLVKLAELRNVTVQVLPFSAGEHPAMGGSFAIFQFADIDEPDIVYVEDIALSVYLERADQLDRYTVACNHLRAVALSPEYSRAFLAEVAAQWS